MILELRYNLWLAGCFVTLWVHAQTVLPPAGLTTVPFERHIELTWDAVTAANVTGYKIYRSDDAMVFTFLKQVGKQNYTFDWTGDEGIGGPPQAPPALRLLALLQLRRRAGRAQRREGAGPRLGGERWRVAERYITLRRASVHTFVFLLVKARACSRS